MDNNKNGFSYSYSAKEQAELKKIRDKYTEAPATESDYKMARLRKLDASVTKTAQIVALVFGVIGALILGFGMSLIMTDFAEFLDFEETMVMVIGIIVGVVGGILASLAYPIYNAMVKAKRKRIAPEIIRLADELMK